VTKWLSCGTVGLALGLAKTVLFTSLVGFMHMCLMFILQILFNPY